MAAQTPAYSNLISCIHDEPGPIGKIGHGTHYSIFRTAEWYDVMRRPLSAAQVHDFAVIWDEDHDTRIIEVVEKLYMKSLLPPVQFIGERKGSLSVIVATKFYNGLSQADLQSYRAAIAAEASDIGGDSWSTDVGSFDRSEGDDRFDPISIIQDDAAKVKVYLRNIDTLWGLGSRIYVPPKHPEPSYSTERLDFGTPQLASLSPTQSLFKKVE